MTDLTLSAARAVLEQHNYRVTAPFEEKACYAENPVRPLLKAAIVDVETTGLVAADSHIVELAILVFEYDAVTGQAYRVTGTYSGFEDPGYPIPAAQVAVHHITDEMVAGQSLDVPVIEALLADVPLIIAHKASFDRGFLERRLPLFERKAWACSVTQINWQAAGIESAKLEYLAYRFGFFFDGHRALVDCRALLEVLQRPLPNTEGLVFKTLLAAARGRECRIAAIGAPFEAKDTLKSRGYHWYPDRKAWARDVPDSEQAAELDWIQEHIYRGNAYAVEVEYLTARNRFTERGGDGRELLRFAATPLPVREVDVDPSIGW